MSMGGTIRCKHGHILHKIEMEIVGGGVEVLLRTLGEEYRSERNESCSLLLPKDAYDNIQQGANFTHVFFKEKEELDKYLKDHAERFQHIGHCGGTLMPYGLYHLVF